MPPKPLLQAIVIVVGLTYAVIWVLQGLPVDDALKPIGAAGAAVSLFLLALEHWLWRAPLLRKAIGRPDLRGTWRGTLRSDYLPSGSTEPHVDEDVYLAVRQTWSGVTAQLLTAESRSSTMLTSLRSDVPGDPPSLLTMYRNVPRTEVRDRSAVHHGAVRLEVGGDPPERLTGDYWTDRGTRGALELTSRQPKAAGDHQAARRLHGLK